MDKTVSLESVLLPTLVEAMSTFVPKGPELTSTDHLGRSWLAHTVQWEHIAVQR
jgi:hypothetical protein